MNRLVRPASFTVPRIAPAVRAITLAALVSLPLHLARAEEWRLIYAVTQEQSTSDPQGTAAPKTESRSYKLTVALGHQSLAVDDGHAKRVYDFARRREVRLNLDKQEYDNWSLFSDIGARVRELQNRFAVGAGLRAVRIAPAGAFGRFENETSLGLELPGMKLDEPEPVIARQDLPDGGCDFRHDGQSVVQFVPAKTPLPALFYPRFASFLAYECSIHPMVRHQLVAAGEIPQLLVMHWRLGNQQITATYRLQSAEPVETDSTVLPADFRPALHQEEPDEPLFQAVSVIRAEGRTTHRLTREEVERFAQDAIAAKRTLDAYLALLEYRLQSGEKHPADFQPYQSEFDRDSRCQRYRASLDQSSNEACRRSLAACESIDRTGLQKAYMLDLQRAVLLQKLGHGNDVMTSPAENNQTVQAEKLFLQVLAANPFLAGAYHDLGGLYDETFRSPMAWVCFDTARQISPEHWLLNDITTLEQRFEHDFPDFF